jgi:hypothetical protein
MYFDKMDTETIAIRDWTTISKSGQIILPILRGRKSQKRTELPFNDSDINWFKRLLELDDVYGSKENRWIEGASQEELREKYK